MTKKKLADKKILGYWIFTALLFGSLISFSQSIQAKTLSPENIAENSRQKQDRGAWRNPYDQSRAEDKSKTNNNKPKSEKKKSTWRGAPTGRRRAGGGRNPDCPSNLTDLTALVPGIDKKAYSVSTVTPNPTFWFYVPQLPETNRQAELVLQEKSGRKTRNIYRKSVNLPEKAGIISITSPAKAEYLLQNGKKYSWSFNVYCGDKEKTLEHIFVHGFVQKEKLPANLENQSKTAEPLGNYLTYKDNEIWLDALTSLGQQRRIKPQDTNIKTNWVNLLNEVGLKEVTDKPIVQHYNLE